MIVVVIVEMIILVTMTVFVIQINVIEMNDKLSQSGS